MKNKVLNIINIILSGILLLVGFITRRSILMILSTLLCILSIADYYTNDYNKKDKIMGILSTLWLAVVAGLGIIYKLIKHLYTSSFLYAVIFCFSILFLLKFINIKKN